MTTATLTNRFTGKSTRIALKTNPAGILWATSRQYNAALRKLGHGPLGSDTSFVVDSAAGRPVAAVEQTTGAWLGNPMSITYATDPLLVVNIDYNRAETPVTYEYDGEHGSTVFQSADMPRDEQEAARKVSDWLDMQS